MKTKYFTIIFLLFLGLKNYYAQTSTGNSDVIILLDNSGSVDNSEFAQMKTSTNLLIENLLKCNNRVSVVHYSTGNIGQPNIYIESDFTNNLSTALNFSRKLAGGDYLHESMGLIANALDNVSNIDIVSPQKTLNKNSSTPLVVFIFTDGYRAEYPISSYLVNTSSPSVSTPTSPNNLAFTNFTNFKNNRTATFVVVHVYPDNISKSAAAGIASFGGNYAGSIEPYPADPYYLQTPRLYYPQTSFILSNADIQDLTDNMCNVIKPAYIDYVFEPIQCFGSYFPHSVYGHYYLPPGTSLVNINMTMENINTGTSYPVSSPVTILSNTEYKFDLNQSNLDPSMPLSGQYVFKISMVYNDGISTSTLVGNNLYSIYYFYDANFDCCSANNDLYITTPVLASNTDSQAANGNIFANNIINSSANAVYHAGTSVVLKENFHAKAGSNFHAFIQPCVDPTIYNNFDFKNTNTSPNDYQIIAKNSFAEKTINSFAEKNDDIRISPNPTSTYINIDSRDQKITSWELYDMSGKSILKGDSKQINVHSLPKTTYLLNIIINNKTITKKIIVK